jgi:hypothetical protein
VPKSLESDFPVGSLRASDLLIFKQIIGDIDADGPVIREALRLPTSPLYAAMEAHGRYWWVFYEVPMRDLAALLAVLQGWASALKPIAEQANPNRAFVDLMHSPAGLEPTRELSDLDGQQQCLFANGMCALLGSIEAIKQYGLSMDELLERASQGSLGHLKKAASIDRLALFTSVGVDAVARASVAGEQAFLSDLFSTGGPTSKRRTHAVSRYLARIIREAQEGSPNKALTSEQLVELFCRRLQLYAYGADAAKSLREFLRRSKIEATT